MAQQHIFFRAHNWFNFQPLYLVVLFLHHSILSVHFHPLRHSLFAHLAPISAQAQISLSAANVEEENRKKIAEISKERRWIGGLVPETGDGLQWAELVEVQCQELRLLVISDSD